MIESLNKKYDVVLGSQSPRRKELLTQLGLNFTVRPSSFEEIADPSTPVNMVPAFLAEQKALDLSHTLKAKELLITADTLVILAGEILGKPRDENKAFDMIRSLSGKWHEVITGVCLLGSNAKCTFSETTHVHFKDLSDEEIWHYIQNYEVLDKAGAYGIQEWIGLVAVNEIKGCFFNVIGLPVPRLYKELVRL
jgi:septum formation protein